MASGLPEWYEKLGSTSSHEMADATAMNFCEEGGMLTMYLASGKRKHDRVFWVNTSTGVISWDKKRSNKPNKSEIVSAVEGAPAIKSAREWFDFIDADSSGELDSAELAELYKKARGEKLKGKELKAAMTEMDTDGSGMISINEFESWWSKHGGDLERYRELALTVLAGEVTLLLVASSLAMKERWVVGLNAVLRSLGRLPSEPEPAPVVSTIPAGWEIQKSQSTGDVYYVNSTTGVTQYEHPAPPTNRLAALMGEGVAAVEPAGEHDRSPSDDDLVEAALAFHSSSAAIAEQLTSPQRRHPSKSLRGREPVAAPATATEPPTHGLPETTEQPESWKASLSQFSEASAEQDGSHGSSASDDPFAAADDRSPENFPAHSGAGVASKLASGPPVATSLTASGPPQPASADQALELQDNWACPCGFQFNSEASGMCVACDTARPVLAGGSGTPLKAGPAEDEKKKKKVERVSTRPYNEWDKWDELDRALTKEIEDDEKADNDKAKAPKKEPEEPEDVGEFALENSEFESGGDWKDICGDGSIFKKITTPGDVNSDKPVAGAGVKCHYVGRLLDGSKFDSSHDRDAHFEFTAGSGVIQGWSDGIVTMEVGETARFAILAHKAYGPSGSPPKIPPNATLQFEIELLSWSDMEDCKGTGGKVQMKVLRAGAPPPGPPGPGAPDGKPKMHHLCKVIYELKTKSGGTIVAKTAEAVEHRIGGGTLPRGVEAALLQIREGASVELKIDPSWSSVRHTEKNSKAKYPAGFLSAYAGKDLAGVRALAAVQVMGKLNGGGYTHTSVAEKLLVSLELASFVEVTDVSKDGGVLLEVEAEGEGYEKPTMYDVCKVKYTFKDEGDDATVVESGSATVGVGLGSGDFCVGLELLLMEMKQGAKAKVRIHPAYSRYTPVGDAPVFRKDADGKVTARKVSMVGEVELVGWQKVEDLSSDKKGGLLLTMIDEGGAGPNGYKKPKDLSNVRIHYSVVAAGTASLITDTKQLPSGTTDLVNYYSAAAPAAVTPDAVEPTLSSFYHAPAPTPDDYPAGWLSGYSGLSLAAVQAAAAEAASKRPRKPPCAEPREYVVDEDDEPVPGMDEAIKKMKNGGKATLRVMPAYKPDLDWTVVTEPRHRVELVVTIELHEMQNLKESWELKGAEKLELCEKLKWTGNLVFKAGDYERALRRYTTAKTMVDSDHDLSDEDKGSAGAVKITLLNNLATVCAKLGQLEEVKKHCDALLKLDEKNVKALVRRGMNHVELKEFDAGEADFNVAAGLEPGSPTVKRAMNDMKKIRKKQKLEDKKVAEKMMAPSPKKKVVKGLTKTEQAAAAAYDAKNGAKTPPGVTVDPVARHSQAVAFLNQKRVAFAPRDTKISYLQQKCGLKAGELDAAFVAAYDLAATEADGLKAARASAAERAQQAAQG